MNIDWNKNPLIPAIAQESGSKDVLMLAYMNEEAYTLTLSTGYAHYYSRSRKRIWKKGESSGHTQKIKGVYIDCDADTILLEVEQKGAACHTGRKSCFFTPATGDINIAHQDMIDPSSIYSAVDTLYHTILERKNSSAAKSWTRRLLDDKELLLSKIIEEAKELVEAIDRENDEQVIYEAADLLYHSLVGLGYRDISPDRIRQEISRRFVTSGIDEKRSRVDRK